MDAFTNEFYKTKYFEGVNYDKITMLNARLRVIKYVGLYDPVQVIEICLVLRVVAPKKFHLLEFIKYTGTQYPATNLKSYCNKMVEVVQDEKLLMHFFQDSLSEVILNWYMRE
jgi:hypothetical protein